MKKKKIQIADGTIVFPHVLINAGFAIGCNAITNSKALIEHNAVIGNHYHISKGSAINIRVIEGDNSFFRRSAVSKQNTFFLGDGFIISKAK